VSRDDNLTVAMMLNFVNATHFVAGVFGAWVFMQIFKLPGSFAFAAKPDFKRAHANPSCEIDPTDGCFRQKFYLYLRTG
jgi:hypothetical protein